MNKVILAFSIISLLLTICCHFLGDVEEIEIQQKPALKVFKNITVIQEPGMVVLEVGIGEGERSTLFSSFFKTIP